MSDNILKLYTDGACSGNPGPGGWAVVYKQDNKWKSMHGYDVDTTNNRMELSAFLVAYTFAAKQIASGVCDEVEILTDSSYVYNSVVQGWIAIWASNNWKNKANNMVKNKDLWKKLLLMLKKFDGLVKLSKVAGHAGDEGNEFADDVAVRMRDKAVLEKMSKDSTYRPPKSFKPGKGYKSSYIYQERKMKDKLRRNG